MEKVRHSSLQKNIIDKVENLECATSISSEISMFKN